MLLWSGLRIIENHSGCLAITDIIDNCKAAAERSGLRVKDGEGQVASFSLPPSTRADVTPAAAAPFPFMSS